MKRKAAALPERVIHTLAPFFPGFDLTRIRVREGIPRYVVGEPLGYADRHTIYFRKGEYRTDTIEGLALIAHELAHCCQYQQCGTWRFRARYLADYFKNRRCGMPHEEAYWHIPFETEARAVEDLVRETLQELDCA